jgi:nucleoside 2-deoxyribosyltransferase
MKKKIAIYLAGTIKKEHETNDTHWGTEELARLENFLSDYDVTFLNPAFRKDSLSDQKSVFGRDMLQVYSADVIFVDARDRRGLGVGAEMMWAKANQKPLIIWAPQNTHYRKESAKILNEVVNDYIHPFVYALSDQVVATLEEGANWIRTLPRNDIKDLQYISETMEYYKANQLDVDTPMKYFLNQNLSKV